jgi:hypothetical protein
MRIEPRIDPIALHPYDDHRTPRTAQQARHDAGEISLDPQMNRVGQRRVNEESAS